MSTCLVTGVAGFIGSNVAERLIAEKCNVVGIDNFSDYYPAQYKMHNLNALLKNPKFTLVQGDLTTIDKGKLLKDVEYVLHFAAQPGVRNSFGSNFIHYLNNNAYATQRLLEMVKGTSLKQFIFASSSSIYGQKSKLPVVEDSLENPISLYGISKLMAEKICRVYYESFDIPITSLRLFTVYGPRQRPDMAFHKFISAILRGEKLQIYGTGSQTRDFTFINDVVDAVLLAMEKKMQGNAFNIGSSISIPLTKSISTLSEIMGKTVDYEYLNDECGESEHTLSNITKAHNILGYSPKWNLLDGLRAEYEWIIRQSN